MSNLSGSFLLLKFLVCCSTCVFFIVTVGSWLCHYLVGMIFQSIRPMLVHLRFVFLRIHLTLGFPFLPFPISSVELNIGIFQFHAWKVFLFHCILTSFRPLFWNKTCFFVYWYLPSVLLMLHWLLQWCLLIFFTVSSYILLVFADVSNLSPNICIGWVELRKFLFI